MDDASIAVISRAEAKAQGLKRYFTGKPCKHGHVAERSVQHGKCIECTRIRRVFLRETAPEKLREATKKWQQENPERVKDLGAARYKAKIEEIKEQQREWRKNNATRKRELAYAWSAANPEKVRESHRKLARRRYATDPVYALRVRISGAIRGSFRAGGYTKRSRTHEYLGCSFDEFKTHIERQFLEGMTWENEGLWHIDHITPISSASTEEEVAALHHFTNLRPLWAADNIRKSDNIEFLI